ncbi:hypothetical protein ABZ896_40535 [Streptomyces sp. NPDC047072]|uniref:hypothetical protein n=1 Tax=Streptomyces sp. NPDC047072 TaxID=3154809 RepID=UPI0033EC7E85
MAEGVDADRDRLPAAGLRLGEREGQVEGGAAGHGDRQAGGEDVPAGAMGDGADQQAVQAVSLDEGAHPGLYLLLLAVGDPLQ